MCQVFLHMRKILLIALFVSVYPASVPVGADPLTIATWNVRFLSDNSRDDAELSVIADIIRRYDLVAVQEARDETVLARLGAMLREYVYVASPRVGRGQKEIYAYFYRDTAFDLLGTPYLIDDRDDLFIREPFVAHFRGGDFDFTLVTIHLLFGDSAADRREELVLMDEVLAAVDEANGAEADVMLLGDFNFPADDGGWQLDGWVPAIAPTQKTTITETSSYDNLWRRPDATREFRGLVEIYAFDDRLFGGDDEAASLAVSDHRPVAIAFETGDGDDDPPGDWNRRAAIGTRSGTGSAGESPPTDWSALTISAVVAAPTDAESVTLHNDSGSPIDLSGAVLGDANNPEAYRFPPGHRVPARGTYTIPRSTFGFAINNSGETIYLTAPDGAPIDMWRN